jgi:HlyD family secretion protein
MSKSKVSFAGAVAVVVLIGGIWWWRSRDGAKLSFTTVTVKRGEVAATIGATGTIEPLEVVDVGAQVDGLIKSFGTDTDGKTVDYLRKSMIPLTPRIFPPPKRRN